MGTLNALVDAKYPLSRIESRLYTIHWVSKASIASEISERPPGLWDELASGLRWGKYP